MLRDELPDLATFAAIAEARSFTRAAGKLGMSQSALSHTIKRLEARLGVRLLTRTTRSIAPTDAGMRLLAALRPALDQIDGELRALTESRGQPSGSLRITSADHAAESLLWPALNRLLADYPGISLDVQVNNELVDIVAQRFDAGIRLGAHIDKDMIATPIGPSERPVVVCSPGYLVGRSEPTEPVHLRDHQCINRHMASLGGISVWTFVRDGRPDSIRVPGQLVFNRPEMILQAALDGHGLAYMLESQAARSILPQDVWSPCCAPGVRTFPDTISTIQVGDSTPQCSNCCSMRFDSAPLGRAATEHGRVEALAPE